MEALGAGGGTEPPPWNFTPALCYSPISQSSGAGRKAEGGRLPAQAPFLPPSSLLLLFLLLLFFLLGTFLKQPRVCLYRSF